MVCHMVMRGEISDHANARLRLGCALIRPADPGRGVPGPDKFKAGLPEGKTNNRPARRPTAGSAVHYDHGRIRSRFFKTGNI